MTHEALCILFYCVPYQCSEHHSPLKQANLVEFPVALFFVLTMGSPAFQRVRNGFFASWATEWGLDAVCVSVGARSSDAFTGVAQRMAESDYDRIHTAAGEIETLVILLKGDAPK